MRSPERKVTAIRISVDVNVKDASIVVDPWDVFVNANVERNASVVENAAKILQKVDTDVDAYTNAEKLASVIGNAVYVVAWSYAKVSLHLYARDRAGAISDEEVEAHKPSGEWLAI